MGLLESIAINGFSGLIANLASEYITKSSKVLRVSEAQLKTDLTKHFEVTFQKCTKIKTIINDKPIDFLSIYIDPNFHYDNINIDQYELIEKIRNGESIVITGTGGGGKSMFMRYLWLSYFERSDGKIPFFLELRQLNSVTHNRLEDFIYHSIVQTKSTISQKNFEDAINSGEFILFLDGFDELGLDIRDKVEQWLLNTKENNPKLTIVASSRPMERFRGWAGFSVTKVRPLTRKQVIDLIEKAPFFDEDKNKLKKKIKEGLYNTHSEFLSNPLLAYMMLVTISYNPEIPVKMHLFYEMAFEALYHRHDLTKNGFKREFHSKLDKQVLIRILSYFSLLTYHAEAYEFDETQYMEFCKKIEEIETFKFDYAKFLEDLIEFLCIIKKEGLDYSFTHRSFQEYFSAYCIARVASRNIEKIFTSFARRLSDQVLVMVYDMNVNLFHEKYLMPLYNKYADFFSKKTNRNIAADFLELRNGTFEFINNATTSKRGVSRGYSIYLQSSGEFAALAINADKISSIELERGRDSATQRRARDDRFIQMHGDRNAPRGECAGRVKAVNSSFYFEPNNDEETRKAFTNTAMYDYLYVFAKQLKIFMNSEKDRYEKLNKSFDDIF